MMSTSIQSHGEVDANAKEKYGEGHTALRIGNGGAGATGLIAYLAKALHRSQPDFGVIEWVQNHSRNTQLALLNGYVDLALTYERDQEAISAEEGWATDSCCAFHDHFVLAGPSSDPAGIASATSLTSALQRIASTHNPFHSRGDTSATMFKERGLWKAAGREPWTEPGSATWYTVTELDPASALINADKMGAYLLTDRATLLRQTMISTIQNTTVFFEPQRAEDILMNSCYASYDPKAKGKTASNVQKFLAYLLSDEGQQVVAAYGVEETGCPLFAPVQDGFSQQFLRGGVPVKGKWLIKLTKAT